MIDVTDGNSVYYYHFDGLGSVVALSDVNNIIVERYSYDVFGEPNRTSDVNNPYLFTGRRYDSEAGLYYYRARYYAYDVGRFLQPDPIGYDDGMNMYTFVGNSPLQWVDPSGLCKGDSLWTRWSNFVRSSDPLTSLGGFGFGILEAVYDMERGLYHTVRHPVQTIKGIPAGIKAIPAAAKQVYSDLTSSDPYTYGNAVGKLTAQIEIALATAKVAGKIKSLRTTRVKSGTKVYRVWGNEAGPYGKSWTPVNPSNVNNFRNVAGLPAQNTGRFVSEGVLTSTKGVVSRKALEIGSNTGGLPELVVPNPKTQILLQRISGVNPKF